MATTTGQPHEILGVAADATAEDIKGAFRRLSKSHHPDAGGTSELFLAIKAARDQMLEDLERPATHTSSSTGKPSGSGRTDPVDDVRISTFGTPGRVDTADFGQAGTVGAAGERMVADLLSRAGLPDHAILLNSVQLGDRGGDMDHVVLLGHHALLIDTKVWAHGSYEVDVDMVYRDGEPFPPALVKSTTTMANVTAERLGIPAGHITVFVAYTDSTGSSSDIHIGFRKEGVSFVGIEDLARRARGWAAGLEHDHGVFAVPPSRLDDAITGTDHRVIHRGPRTDFVDPTSSDNRMSAAVRYLPVAVGLAVAIASLLPLGTALASWLTAADHATFDATAFRIPFWIGVVGAAAMRWISTRVGSVVQRFFTRRGANDARWASLGLFGVPMVTLMVSAIVAAVGGFATTDVSLLKWAVAALVAAIVGVTFLAVRRARQADLHVFRDVAERAVFDVGRTYPDPARRLNALRYAMGTDKRLHERDFDRTTPAGKLVDGLWNHLMAR